MKPVISIQNDGLVDMRAVTTFGVSSKESDNPIGFFGTGFKYAIAIFLREGCEVTVYRGTERFDFSTSKTQIRVGEFDIVTMNGQELGYTTELGKNWEPWMAFREIACNAMDEPNSVMQAAELEPRPDATTVVIRGRVAGAVWAQKDDIFLPTKAKYSFEGVEFHAKRSRTNPLYYREVRVATLTESTLFDFNIVEPKLKLTEDRTLSWSTMFDVNRAIAHAIAHADDRDFLRMILIRGVNTYEGELSYGNESTASDQFLSVVKELGYTTLHNDSARDLYKRVKGIGLERRETQLELFEKKMLDKAYEVTRFFGLDSSFKVVPTQDLEQGTLGLADRKTNTVYLNKRVFSMGTKMVAGTLFEEFLHLEKGYNDESRNMQNFLIDQLMTSYERHIGEPL
jgi:hypothetical protein